MSAWKDFKSKPQYPRAQMQTTVWHKQTFVPDPDTAGKTLVMCDECRISLWDSQLRQVADIMERHDFKKDVKIVWIPDPANARYIIPSEVTEEM